MLHKIDNHQYGIITKSFGRSFIVTVNNKDYETVTLGKKVEFVVGDQVVIRVINQSQAQIIKLIERSNLLYRSDHNRSKIIASNLSQIIIVIAIKPSFNLHFLNTCLLAAEAININPIIVINKVDLQESKDFIIKINNLYGKILGYNVEQISAQENCETLQKYLNNNISILIGQSGVGKSTIINQIISGADAKVDRINKKETTGMHTTTHATLYTINNNSKIIDCPGMQEFGLLHLDIDCIAEYFPELTIHLGKCKFRTCRHLNEPECAIIKAHHNGLIDDNRFYLLQELTKKLLCKPKF